MITSTKNQQVKEVRLLQTKGKARRRQRLFVAEGPKLVLETPGELIVKVFVAESYADIWQEKAGRLARQELVSDRVMEAMSDTATPQGVLAIVRQPEYTLEDLLAPRPAHLLLIEGIQDPGNLGTIFRTGEGAGVTGIVMNEAAVDLFHPKTVRSTMGSIYRVPFFVAADWQKTLGALSSAGVTLYAAHLQGTKKYDTFDYRKSCGFLIGNEGNGLTAKTAEAADCYLKIPMEGKLESLNAAMAAGILMYEVHRQRQQESESR